MATKKKVAKKPEAAKKHWFTDKKGSKGKEAYLKKHPNSKYHPSNQGPPRPDHVIQEQKKARKAAGNQKAKKMKSANERVEKYRELIKKGEQHFIKLGQRPKELNAAKAWEEKRKKILDGIKKYKLAMRGAQSVGR